MNRWLIFIGGLCTALALFVYLITSLRDGGLSKPAPGAASEAADFDASAHSLTQQVSGFRPAAALADAANSRTAADYSGQLSSAASLASILDEMRREPDPERRFEQRAALYAALDRYSTKQLVALVTAKDEDALFGLTMQAIFLFGDADMLQAVVDRHDSLPPGDRLRGFFAETVRQWSAPEAIEALADLGAGVGDRGYEEDDLSWGALAALARIGSPPAVDALIGVAEKLTGPAADNVPLLLGSVRSPEAIPVLEATANGLGRTSPMPIRVLCVQTLAIMDDFAATDALRRLSSHPDDRVASEAQTALTRIEAARNEQP